MSISDKIAIDPVDHGRQGDQIRPIVGTQSVTTTAALVVEIPPLKGRN